MHLVNYRNLTLPTDSSDEAKFLGPPTEMHIESNCQDPIEASKIHVQRCIAELDLLLKLHNA